MCGVIHRELNLSMVRRCVGMQFNSSGRMRSQLRPAQPGRSCFAWHVVLAARMACGPDPFDPASSHIHRCSAAAGSEGGATRRAVLRMLQGGELADAASVIVYCTYQAQVRKVQVKSHLGFSCQ